MPILYILCGIPGCGKTTWAEDILNKYDMRYVSRDYIRLHLLKADEEYFSKEQEVFKKFSGTLAQTLVDGFDVIADATHLNIPSRKKLIKAIDKYTTEYRIIYVYFNTDLHTCLERNAARQGRARVPDDAMLNMYQNFVPPMLTEDKRILNIVEVN